MARILREKMNPGDIVLIRGGLGCRPGMVEQMGKRKTQVSWADGKKEWVDNKRVKAAENLKDKAWMIRMLKLEKEIGEK